MAKVVAALVAQITPGSLVFLEGELGAGKTTLVRYFLRALGYQGIVKSPTYTLVEAYDCSDYSTHLLPGCQMIYHWDLYRLATPEELLLTHFSDYLDPTALLFVEWPSKGVPFLPVPDFRIEIEVVEAGRRLSVEAITNKS